MQLCNFNILRVSRLIIIASILNTHYQPLWWVSYRTFNENAHASTDTMTPLVRRGSCWLTDRIAQTSSKSSWYKVTLRKWRGTARAICRWLCASESARGNVSVNVNANSNMPVIIISASTVARRPFPDSSWHPLSFVSVARRWLRGSLISRNCDDPRPMTDP